MGNEEVPSVFLFPFAMNCCIFHLCQQCTALAMFLYDLGSVDGLGANYDIYLQHHLLCYTEGTTMAAGLL